VQVVILLVAVAVAAQPIYLPLVLVRLVVWDIAVFTLGKE
jgi:hypothetical protein